MTIDKTRLRVLAEAASQGRWNQDGFEVHNDDVEDYRVARCRSTPDAVFIAAAEPATVLALLGEIERLEKFRTAYMEWSDKTDWVLGLATVKDLGKHRAEVLREHFDRLKAENEVLRKDAARLTWLDKSKEIDSVGPTLCCGKHRPDLREAIDAAMAMEARHG